MRKTFAFLCFALLTAPLAAQEQHDHSHADASDSVRWYYDTDLLPAAFHRARRQALRELMPDSSLAVFFANPVRNRANDVYYEYHQDPNFYYMTGLREPHAVLLVWKSAQDCGDSKCDEYLFLQPRDKANEVWNGKRLGLQGAQEYLEFDNAAINSTFADFELDLSAIKHLFVMPPPDDLRDDKTERGDLASLLRHFTVKTQGFTNGSDARQLAEFMATLREIKLQEELELMQVAIDITCEAQAELMRSLQPNMTEYEAESVVEFVFKNKGAEYPGFPSILGGGENSCTLHYVTNRKTLHDGEVLVSDIGAEYHGYTADVTRTMPVNGKFSEEQRLIYELVLQAQIAGIKACKPGNRFWAADEAARSAIKSGMMRLGITDSWNGAERYFIHGTSHYLGLDVHDAGNFGDLEPGNVLTVEPGIYIPEGSPCDPKWWNIGVRIEDDVLITTTGNKVLSDCVPKTVAEIEAVMAE